MDLDFAIKDRQEVIDKFTAALNQHPKTKVAIIGKWGTLKCSLAKVMSFYGLKTKDSMSVPPKILKFIAHTSNKFDSWSWVLMFHQHWIYMDKDDHRKNTTHDILNVGPEEKE